MNRDTNTVSVDKEQASVHEQAIACPAAASNSACNSQAIQAPQNSPSDKEHESKSQSSHTFSQIQIWALLPEDSLEFQAGLGSASQDSEDQKTSDKAYADASLAVPSSLLTHSAPGRFSDYIASDPGNMAANALDDDASLSDFVDSQKQEEAYELDLLPAVVLDSQPSESAAGNNEEDRIRFDDDPEFVRSMEELERNRHQASGDTQDNGDAESPELRPTLLSRISQESSTTLVQSRLASTFFVCRVRS